MVTPKSYNFCGQKYQNQTKFSPSHLFTINVDSQPQRDANNDNVNQNNGIKVRKPKKFYPIPYIGTPSI